MALVGSGVEVAAGTIVNVGVRVGVSVNVGVGVNVNVGVGVGVSVNAGPNDCPCPQLDIIRLATNKPTTKIEVSMTFRFVFINLLRYYGRTRLSLR